MPNQISATAKILIVFEMIFFGVVNLATHLSSSTSVYKTMTGAENISLRFLWDGQFLILLGLSVIGYCLIGGLFSLVITSLIKNFVYVIALFVIFNVGWLYLCIWFSNDSRSDFGAEFAITPFIIIFVQFVLSVIVCLLIYFIKQIYGKSKKLFNEG